jgi:hypothetical protein
MSARNVLASLLAALVALNATCACATVTVGDVSGDSTHAHHGDAGQMPHAADCLQPDCLGDCEKAVGAASSKEPNPLPGAKLVVDIDWSAFRVAPHAPGLALGSTGPPSGATPAATNTPVLRFDRQLK